MPAAEGTSRSKAEGSPCVAGPSSKSDFVTKGELNAFATELFSKMDELKSLIISQQNPQDLSHIKEALKELSSTTTELKHSLATLQSSAIKKDDLTEAFQAMSLNPSSVQTLKNKLSEMAAKFAGDFVTAGYTDYSSFRDEIKEMFSSAVTYGIQSKSSSANINHLATRRELDAMVDALADSMISQLAFFKMEILSSNEKIVEGLTKLAKEGELLRVEVLSTVSKLK